MVERVAKLIVTMIFESAGPETARHLVTRNVNRSVLLKNSSVTTKTIEEKLCAAQSDSAAKQGYCIFPVYLARDRDNYLSRSPFHNTVQRYTTFTSGTFGNPVCFA